MNKANVAIIKDAIGKLDCRLNPEHVINETLIFKRGDSKYNLEVWLKAWVIPEIERVKEIIYAEK